MDDPDLKLLMAVIILIVFGVVGWQYREELFGEPEAEPVIAAPAPAEPAAALGPRHPMPDASPGVSSSGELVPLPPLDDSDAYFLIEIGTAFGPAIESLLRLSNRCWFAMPSLIGS
jgi:hypothetical protein